MSLKDYEKFELNVKHFKGFMGKDPEIDYKDSGSILTKFFIPLKLRNEDEAVLLSCQAWGSLAEQIADNYKKGDRVVISGYFTESEYKGKNYVTFNVVTIGKM